MNTDDTIVALSTPPGIAALAVIRLSGKDAIAIASKIFKGENLSAQASHTIHYGHIMDGINIVDEVMLSIFKSPRSFTTEDMVEISCHGSPLVAEQIIRLLIENGARAAAPGEFTLRAFIHGRIDLSQAEAVADLIAANSNAAHDVAIKQMRGGFSNQLKDLRSELLNFASLIELELDFSEEDVEFANRAQLTGLINKIQLHVAPLIESFKLGNVIKHGVNTVIAGKPNSGKSTLLNALLNEERALVSDIPGTTRDTIEEVININGLQFRLIDTAGLRITEDVIEKMGVEKTREKLRQSSVFIYLFDVNTTKPEELIHELDELELTGFKGLAVGNKIDIANWKLTAPFYKVIEESQIAHHRRHAKHGHAPHHFPHLLFISSLTRYNLPVLKEKLYELVAANGQLETQNTIVTNLRHYEALLKANEALTQVKSGIESGTTNELVAFDIKRALEHLGQITGEVTNDEILGNIFGKFCIGK